MNIYLYFEDSLLWINACRYPATIESNEFFASFFSSSLSSVTILSFKSPKTRIISQKNLKN